MTKPDVSMRCVWALEPFTRQVGIRIPATLLIVNALLILAPSFANGQSYEKSNAGVSNVQASSPTFAGATDRTGACVTNAAYNNHRSESWVALDPTNSKHLVGMAKFFFDPLFYLFHLGVITRNDQQQFFATVPIPSK